MTETASATEDEGDTYRGLFGAFPYAFRASGSRLFRSYVVLGGLAALLIAVTFALGVVTLVGNTTGAGAGTFTFSRSFFIVVGLAAVAPVIAPVLFVARRHRRTGSDAGYDRALALSGYVFLASLYLLLVISAPPERRDSVTGSGPVADAVRFLYDLDAVYGLLPPLVVAVVMYLVHRRLR
jgi:uncharacterized membrane protein YuzA (DUF378 family)